MSYRGDKTEQLAPGRRLGPTNDGILLEITASRYDPETDRTIITTRPLEVADSRLRFTGGGE